VLADPSAAAHIRVRAAEVVLSQLLRLRELRDIEQRLVVLEVAWRAK
jgi:hypothetical protein